MGQNHPSPTLFHCQLNAPKLPPFLTLKLQPTTEKILIDCLLISLAIFIPYSQVAQHRFIEFDDGLYTYQNTHIIRGLTWESIVWAFTNTDAANWHPLTWITHLIDRELFGPHAGGYLLMNVAWHTLAACSCYLAFFKCTKQRFFALTVAIIFAVHPANVENVAWTSERKSLLDAFFWFIGIIAYIEYLESRKLRFYGIVMITHLLGLMAKAMHVTFPCTLILLHLLHMVSTANGQTHTLRDYRTAIFASLKLVWPLLLISGYFSFVTASAQSLAMSSMENHSVIGRSVNALQSYQKYILMFYNPGDLAPFYPLFFTEQQLARAIFPGILLCLVTVLLLLLARKRPVPLLGWFWFLGTMVPVVGLVQVGSQSHADRYLYIPMLGLAFVFPELFGALHSWSIKKLNYFHTAWLAITAIALGAATYIQVGYWKDGVSLFQHSLRVTGDCMTSVNCLTCAYLRNGRTEDALRFLESKISIAKNPINIAKFYSLKSQAHLMLNQYENAIKSAHQSIAHGSNDAITYWTLANAYYKADKIDQSKEAFAITKKLLTAPNRTMLMDAQIQDGLIVMEAVLKNADTSSAANAKKYPHRFRCGLLNQYFAAIRAFVLLD